MTRTAIRRSIQLLVLAAIAFAFLTQVGPRTTSAATPLTFVVQGTVTSVDASLAGTVSINDPFTLIYTFDPLTPDLLPGNPGIGDYFGAISNMIVNVASYDASASSGNIQVLSGGG